MATTAEEVIKHHRERGKLLQFSEPTETGHEKLETADIRQPIALPGLPDLEVDLAGLL